MPNEKITNYIDNYFFKSISDKFSFKKYKFKLSYY